MATTRSATRNKRLVADIAELERAPVERAAAIAVDDDHLGEFYCKIAGADDTAWEGLTLGLIITCGDSYPFSPPVVEVCSFYPHPNVVPHGQGFKVCLDLLEPSTSTSRAFECWSPAFSIRSVLVQLTSFIGCDDSSTDHTIPQSARVRAMLEAAEHEYPLKDQCTLPTAHDLEAASRRCWSSTSLPVASLSAFNRCMEKLFAHRIASMTTTTTAFKPVMCTTIEEEGENASDFVSATATVSVDTAVATATAATATTAAEPVEDEDEDEDEGAWTFVRPSAHVHSTSTTNALTPSSSSSGERRAPATASSLLNLFASGSGHPTLVCSSCGKTRPRKLFSRSQLEKGNDRRCSQCVGDSIIPKLNQPEAAVGPSKADLHNASVVGYSGGSTSAAPPLSKKAAKHKRRKDRARMNKLEELMQSRETKTDDPDEDVSSIASSATSAAPMTPASSVPPAAVVATTATPPSPPTVSQSRLWALGWGAGSSSAAANFGSFRYMSRHATASLAKYLTPRDVLAWARTCRAAAAAGEDNWVWKVLLSRRYPSAPILDVGGQTAHPPGAMKMAYVLALNGLDHEPCCMTTRAVRHDVEYDGSATVLGWGVEHTVNPKTGVSDYITTCGELLTYGAFKNLKVRTSVFHENAKEFTAFIPVYLDAKHFEENGGLKRLLATARALAPTHALSSRPQRDGRNGGKAYVPPHRRSGAGGKNRAAALQDDERENLQRSVFESKTQPEAALEILLTIWKTLTIQIVDKAIAPSEKVLEVFCQLHRLMIALIEQFPSLRTTIHQRLDTFVRHPSSRVKKICPNLGQLIPLLVVSQSYEWRHLAIAYLQESFDRGHLWACTHDSSLAEVVHGDESRIDRVLAATRVSQRMTMMSVFLVRLLRPRAVDGKPASLEHTRDSYDVCLGRPPLFVRRAWHKGIRAVLDADEWPKIFAVLGCPLPSKNAFLGILEAAAKNSLKKGYHDARTRFERIHRSGVSHILLKGESYSAPPNLKRVRLTDRWKLAGGVDYLDATCFIYAGSKRLGLVDYQSTTWGADFGGSIKPVGNSTRVFEMTNNARDCVWHSGDMIDNANNVGEHTIDIDLRALPSQVTSLVFAISSWHGTLSDAIQPQCVLSDAGDPSARTELCEYEFEGGAADKKGPSPTAVIMCTLTRSKLGGRWEMNAIGHQGQGRATGMAPGYGPIYEDIRALGLLDPK